MYQLPVLCLLKPENSFYFMSQEQFSYERLMPFSVQVMLLGFVLLGRSLEEKARIRASSDMNELLVSSNHFYIYYCKKQLGCLLDSHVKSNSCSSC